VHQKKACFFLLGFEATHQETREKNSKDIAVVREKIEIPIAICFQQKKSWYFCLLYFPL
jgi:hypothetical protein